LGEISHQSRAQPKHQDQHQSAGRFRRISARNRTRHHRGRTKPAASICRLSHSARGHGVCFTRPQTCHHIGAAMRALNRATELTLFSVRTSRIIRLDEGTASRPLGRPSLNPRRSAALHFPAAEPLRNRLHSVDSLIFATHHSSLVNGRDSPFTVGFVTNDGSSGVTFVTRLGCEQRMYSACPSDIGSNLQRVDPAGNGV